MKHNLNYGYDMQHYYLETLLSDPETFTRLQSIFDPSLFDKKLQLVAEFILTYADTYQALPPTTLVNAATGIQFKELTTPRPNHLESVLDGFEQFTKHKSLERAIIESADLLEQGDYLAVEKKIKQAVEIGLTRNMGTNYFENPKERLLALRTGNGQISTGLKSLDLKLFGGMNRKELHVFLGQPGAGKSIFLQNLGINMALAGHNVIYFTLELNEQLVAMRMDSMITETPSNEIYKKLDDVDLQVRMIGKKSGSYQVKYFPGTTTKTAQLKGYIKEYETQHGIKPDVILIDYLDLLAPNSNKINVNDTFTKDKYVSEEVRNLGNERDCLMVSASQLNRSSIQEMEFDLSHIGGGISKANTADGTYAILNTRTLRERGRIQLQLLKTRNSSGVGSKIDLAFFPSILRIKDLDESEWDAPTETTEDIINKIKTRSESTRLKDLLHNLPEEF